MKKMFLMLLVMVLALGMVIPVAAGNGPGLGGNGDTGNGSNGGSGVCTNNCAGPQAGTATGAGPGPEAGPVAGTGAGTDYQNGAQAGNASPRAPRSFFVLTGTIDSVGANNITVLVQSGSKLVQPQKGALVTLVVTATTRYLLKEADSITVIGFTDLQVGDRVSVQGGIADSVLTASRITVGTALTCLP